MHIAVVLRLPLLLVCATLVGLSGVKPVWWTKELRLPDLADVNQRLQAPWEEQIRIVEGETRVTIASCADYQKYYRSGYRPRSDRELRVLQYEGVDCAALECLRRARPARVSYLADFALDVEAPQQLPAQFGVAISREEVEKELQATKRGISWQEYLPTLKAQSSGDSLVVQVAGMRIILQLYARADFNHDGIEDVLIRQDFSAEQGTYAGSRLFLLTRQGRANILRVLERYE